MRILFLSRLFYPHIGGVEKHVLELSKNLSKRGHKITIITEKYDIALKNREELDGITIFRISVPKKEKVKKFYIWYWMLRNSQIIKKADIVHCHDVFFWYLPFRFIFYSKPVYTTFHGYEGNSIPDWKSKLMHRLAEKFSSGNICVGKFLEKWYGTKATLITYGAAKSHRTARAPQAPKNTALFIGRLEAETGIEDYLKAINILKKRGMNIELTVLGSGSLREKSEKFCNSQKLNVYFKGFVEDIDTYLQNVSLVFTSRYLGIIEALTYKKFVIAQYNNEIKYDYLTISPFKKYIVIEKKPKAIAVSIEKFLDKKNERDNEAISGYGWARSQTWERLTNIYLNLWKT